MTCPAFLKTFRRLWLPLCHELGLSIVGEFGSGLSITGDIFDDVVRELQRLYDETMHRVAVSPDYQNMSERICAIVSKLLAYKGNEAVDIWIG